MKQMQQVQIKNKFGYLSRNILLSAFFAMLCLLFSFSAQAGINAMRVGQGVGNVRLVFDADQKFDYKVFLLSDPKRLIIDTQNIKVNSKIVKEIMEKINE